MIKLGLLLMLGVLSCLHTSNENIDAAASEVEAHELAFAKTMEDRDFEAFSWQPDVVEVLESGRLALSSGPVLSASGDIIGRFNSIWRKENDGNWRVIFDTGS